MRSGASCRRELPQANLLAELPELAGEALDLFLLRGRSRTEQPGGFSLETGNPFRRFEHAATDLRVTFRFPHDSLKGPPNIVFFVADEAQVSASANELHGGPLRLSCVKRNVTRSSVAAC